MKILIAGLAKTGTTGLLYLVVNSLSKLPKIVFEPKKCPADLSSESGVVVAKVLIGPSVDVASFAHFDRKITIVRDPRDRLVSALLYSQFHANYLTDDERVRAMRECLERKESNPASISIREIFAAGRRFAGKSDSRASARRLVATGTRGFEEYIKAIPDGFLYKYEDFVSGEYAPVENYLGMPLSGAAKVPDHFHRVERTKGYGDWRNWFTPEDVRDYQPVLSSWLEKYGYDPDDWRLNEKPSIAAEHCSLYFMRLVEEHRDRPAAAARKLTGRIIKAEPEIVSGWAVGTDLREPARIALLVNGNEVAQAVADKHRPGLQKRGIHPTGRCGFAFTFEPGKFLQAGDEVTVKPVGAEAAFERMSRIVGEAAPQQAD